MSRQFSEDMQSILMSNSEDAPKVVARLKKLKREHAAMLKYIRVFDAPPTPQEEAYYRRREKAREHYLKVVRRSKEALEK